MSDERMTPTLSIFKVEFVTYEEGKNNGGRWATNRTEWVVIDGDALAAATAVVDKYGPDITIHVVRRHASGASVLVVDSGSSPDEATR